MTGTSIVKARSYLDDQRRSIIARAVLGSLAGAIPVPFVDDWAKEIVLGTGYRAIARARHVDIDDAALKSLVHGKSSEPAIANMAMNGVMYRVAGIAARRMMVAITTLNRARSAARTFVTMTLFDHYCAKLHTGFALDSGTALALHEDISHSIEGTPGALAFHPFRRGLLGAARATLRAPLELADMATRGRVRKLLTRKSGEDGVATPIVPIAVDELELAMDAALANKKGFLSRAVAAVEVQLSSEANPFLDAAIASFDRRWRARVAAGTTTGAPSKTP